MAICMGRARCHLPKLAVALAIGFAIEALLGFGLTGSPRWLSEAIWFTQEPGLHIANLLVPLLYAGFEKGIGCAYVVIFLCQGTIFGTAIYLVFTYRRKRHVSTL